MSQWYYLTDRQERVAVNADQMPALALTGILRPGSLVWQKGQKDWVPCSEVRPEIFTGEAKGARQGYLPALPAGVEAAVVTSLARPLASGSQWFRWLGVIWVFAGIVMIIGGGILSWQMRNGLPEALARNPAMPPGLDLTNYLWINAISVAVAAVVYIWLGILLMRVAAQATQAADEGNAAALLKAQSILSRCAMILVLLTLIAGLFFSGFAMWQGYRAYKQKKEAPPVPAVSL